MKINFQSLSAITRLPSKPLSEMERVPYKDASKGTPLSEMARTPYGTPSPKQPAPSKKPIKISRVTVDIPVPDTKTVVIPKKPANAAKDPLTDSTDAFLKMMLLIMLKTYGQNTSAFNSKFVDWVAAARPFLTKCGLLRTVMVAANIYKTRGLYEEELVDLGKELRAKSREGAFDGKMYVTIEQRKLMKDIFANFKANPSDLAWNRIHSDVRILNDLQLNRAFVEEEKGVTSELKTTISRLSSLVKRVTGASTCFLTTDEAMELRKTDPDTAVKISGYAKQLRTAIKKAILAYVRSAPKHEVSEEGNIIVPISDVQKHLSSIGLPNNLPIGLTGGKIDELGRIYTAQNLMLAGIPEGRVVMNPDYNPERNNTYVCKIERTAGRNFEYRTVKMNKAAKNKKFDAVQEFIAKEDQFRAKWIRLLSSKNHLDRVLGAMMEIMYKTSARIGGKNNETAGEKTYGLTTLLVEHIKITPKRVEFDYTGKKGTNQGASFIVKTPSDVLVRDILSELVENKGPKDLVFTSNRRNANTGKPVYASTLRTMMEKLGIPITPHKFRHAIATKMAMDILATSKFKKGSAKQAEVERWVKEAMIKVGVQLHHKNGENETSSTALKSYISPDVILDYFTKLGLHAPAFLREKK